MWACSFSHSGSLGRVAPRVWPLRLLLLLRSLFQQEVLKRGLLTHGNHMLTFSHDDAVIEETLRIYSEVFEILADAIRDGQVEQRLEGTPVQSIFREV